MCGSVSLGHRSLLVCFPFCQIQEKTCYKQLEDSSSRLLNLQRAHGLQYPNHFSPRRSLGAERLQGWSWWGGGNDPRPHHACYWEQHLFFPFILIFSFYIWVVNEDDLCNHDVSCRLYSYLSPVVFWCMVLKLLWFTLLQILVFSCLNNSLELSKEISWGQLTHFHQKPDILEMARKQLRGTGAAYSAVCQPSPGREPGPWDSCQQRCCWGSWGSVSLPADHR